ncbi:hypothetical protein [Mesorhizobium sp. RMAD-H1]|uniref:hypothetical protein n=1 Tax=Mesorhizobium sp. RMAD-H1 TaxID=2587065 RepID=UPI0016130EAE|nr:hypothetical protein [Mesorhizobium sp. RMAD-H1]MBB2973984.1 hypothetical protein [Mesorhizobium sp. RMAD-H1]
MLRLSEFELKVLNAFSNGTVDDLTPGAALNAAAAFLAESGFLNLRKGCPTAKGYTTLKNLDAQRGDN